MRLIRYVFIFTFLALLYFPLVNNWSHIIIKSYDGIIPVAPRFDIRHLDKYPKTFDDYFDETLEIKPWLVGINSNLKIRLLNISPVPDKVLIGNDGWLFMAGKSVDEYMGINHFSDAQLDSFKQRLDYRATYCKEKYNCSLFFFIAPLKHTIYPEYLPLSVTKISNTTRYDQVMEKLKGDTIIHTVDLRDDLLMQKSSHLLFYKTDNHWNDIGGAVAYRKMASEIKRQIPEFPIINLSIFRLDSGQNLIGGEAEMMNAGNIYSEKRFDYYPTQKCLSRLMPKRGYVPPQGFPYPNDYEIQMQTGDSTLPDAVIIRDSFSDALLPFWSESFDRSTFIFDAWEYNKNFNIIETERPKIIIYILLESNLNSIIDYN
jgi:hypothetical protein